MSAPASFSTPDFCLALLCRQRHGPLTPTEQTELEVAWAALSASQRQQVHAWLAPPLHTGGWQVSDPCVNELLALTQATPVNTWPSSAWWERWEEVRARLALPQAAARDTDPAPVFPLPLRYVQVDASGTWVAHARDPRDLLPRPGHRVRPVYAGHPQRPPPPQERAASATARARLAGTHFAPCPFCGHAPETTEDALRDSLHPVTRDGRVWSFGCNEVEGGCGARVLGDTPEHCQQRWNARAEVVDLVAHLERQALFSERTFGPGARTQGVLAHIRKELVEIADDPADLMEWIDVVLLALDGARRAGHAPRTIAHALGIKQARNEARQWPDWRTAAPDAPIEHLEPGESDPAHPPPPLSPSQE